MAGKTSLILSHASALAYWFNASGSDESRVCNAQECWRALDSVRGSVHVKELGEILKTPVFANLEKPIDLLTSSRNDRRTTSLASYHCVQTELPDNSLVRISCEPFARDTKLDVYVSSPELCFVQAACTLPIWELIELGYEMCGDYTRFAGQKSQIPDASSGPDIIALNKRISSPERLQAFTASCSGITGSKRARQAAKWLVAQSCSSEETHISMLAFLPRSLGGMGTPRPLLNQRIAAPDLVARALGTRTLTPDLYWPDARVALEYDGRIWSNAHARDEYESRKRNAYRIMGIDVVSIGCDDFDHPDVIRERFDLVNRRCEKRLKAPNAKQCARQESLMKWIGARS